MLRGLVLDYYYINLKSNPLSVSFDKLCESTRNYFEGSEYKRDIFTQWNALKLRTGDVNYRVPVNSHQGLPTLII